MYYENKFNNFWFLPTTYIKYNMIIFKKISIVLTSFTVFMFRCFSIYKNTVFIKQIFQLHSFMVKT